MATGKFRVSSNTTGHDNAPTSNVTSYSTSQVHSSSSGPKIFGRHNGSVTKRPCLDFNQQAEVATPQAEAARHFHCRRRRRYMHVSRKNHRYRPPSKSSPRHLITRGHPLSEQRVVSPATPARPSRLISAPPALRPATRHAHGRTRRHRSQTRRTRRRPPARPQTHSRPQASPRCWSQHPTGRC